MFLLEIKAVLQTQPLRQTAGVQSKELARLIVSKTGVLEGESQRDRAISQIRLGKGELILGLTRTAL